jgi:hypothetical protein
MSITIGGKTPVLAKVCVMLLSRFQFGASRLDLATQVLVACRLRGVADGLREGQPRAVERAQRAGEPRQRELAHREANPRQAHGEQPPRPAETLRLHRQPKHRPDTENHQQDLREGERDARQHLSHRRAPLRPYERENRRHTLRNHNREKQHQLGIEGHAAEQAAQFQFVLQVVGELA